MSVIIKEQLQAGIIFGDNNAGEYIYLPGGEVGVENPICRFESPKGCDDIPIIAAVELVLRLSLKPAVHPQLGNRAY